MMGKAFASAGIDCIILEQHLASLGRYIALFLVQRVPLRRIGRKKKSLAQETHYALHVESFDPFFRSFFFNILSVRFLFFDSVVVARVSCGAAVQI